MSLGQIAIRDAVVDDAPAIVDFQLRMARETEDMDLDRAICSAGVQAVFADPSRGRYLVAEATQQSDDDAASAPEKTVDKTVIGSLMITDEWSDWRNGTVWWIQSVYVDSSARGQGVYRRMYEHIRQQVATRDDLCGVRLYVDLRNAAAQQVYSRLGMNSDHYKLFEWMKS